MTLAELKNLLSRTGYPVAFSHFNEPKTPPFIAYITPDEPNFKADNRTYHKIVDVEIELYTEYKDLVAEQAVEDALNSAELPWEASQVYIDSEKLHQKTYEVRLI